MTPAVFVPLFPLVILTLAAVMGMLAIAVRRNHELTVSITVLGLVAALLALPMVGSNANRDATSLLVFDNFALFYLGLVFAASLLIALMTHGYFTKRKEIPDEFYLLLLTAALGSGVLVAARHFISFFVGLEILSISLYAMVAYPRDTRNSIEAGVKYLVLAAGSAAFLLFGMALIYAMIGSMDFVKIAQASTGADPVLLLGLGLMIVGMGFKLAVVPFHLWTPDVYQGAPAPATAFVASVSKGAMFAVLLRFFALLDLSSHPSLVTVFVLISVASMTVGNLLALLQTNVKRILAYSSIANLGYLLVAFLATGSLAPTAAAFYLTSYFATVLGAFGVLIYVSNQNAEAEDIADYRGLFWREPWLALAFTVMMLSLAGIPLTAGFIAKFLVLAAAGQSAQWLILAALVLNSTLGLYYYLRVILSMSAPFEDTEPHLSIARSLGGTISLGFLTVVVVFLGVCPAPWLEALNVLVGGVTTLLP